MNESGRIIQLDPPAALPGGEVLLKCEGLKLRPGIRLEVLCGERPAHLVGAAQHRILACVPEDTEDGQVTVQLVAGGLTSAPQPLIVAERLADDLHPVANPAYSPRTGALYVTRSGARGQELPVTIFQLDEYGDLQEFSGAVMNPTGIAFNKQGDMYVSSRADGTVYRVTEFAAVPFAQDLGVVTGLAFNRAGELFAGDRAGTIFRLDASGHKRVWAELEPSVAAYHLAFGPGDALYVTGPTVASNDCIWRISAGGIVEKFRDGFVRPQGMAFDRAGNLYVVACHKARRGIWRIPPVNDKIELVVSGNNLVGLYFSPDSDLIAATTDALFRVPLGIYGTLL